jgi:hypothetical protein
MRAWVPCKLSGHVRDPIQSDRITQPRVLVENAGLGRVDATVVAVRITGTGFVVPVKLSSIECVAQATRGLDQHFQVHAADHPFEAETPIVLFEGAGQDPAARWVLLKVKVD